MSGYKTFAVWGAGNLGSKIVDSLLERQAYVIVLTRPESKDNQANRDFAAKSVIIRPYDVQGADAVSGLEDVDVLISTAGSAAVSLQIPLEDAAKKAGVQLFVPSEFGDAVGWRSTNKVSEPKLSVRKHAADIGLPTALYFSGLWTEFFQFAGFDLKAGTITINGQGDAEISTTSIVDIADFVAYTLTELQKDKLENAEFTLQGDKVTFNGVAQALQQHTNKKFNVTHVSRATLEEKLAAGDQFAALFLHCDSGLAAHPHPPSHHLYPGFRPKTVLEVLGPLAQ